MKAFIHITLLFVISATTTATNPATNTSATTSPTANTTIANTDATTNATTSETAATTTTNSTNGTIATTSPTANTTIANTDATTNATTSETAATTTTNSTNGTIATTSPTANITIANTDATTNATTSETAATTTANSTNGTIATTSPTANTTIANTDATTNATTSETAATTTANSTNGTIATTSPTANTTIANTDATTNATTSETAATTTTNSTNGTIATTSPTANTTIANTDATTNATTSETAATTTANPTNGTIATTSKTAATTTANPATITNATTSETAATTTANSTNGTIATASPTATIPESPNTNTIVTVSSLAPRVTSSATSGPNLDVNGCLKDSCNGSSTCITLNVAYFCLCIDGYYYNSSTCNKGKTFPGTITISISDTSDLEDKTSAAYEKLYNKIIAFFRTAFAKLDHGQTVIYNVRILPSAGPEMRVDSKNVDVTVVNIFSEHTTANEETISDAINNSIQNNPDGITRYNSQDRCDFYGCVKDKDDCSNGFSCTCKEGLERPNPQIPLCIAKCSDTCNEEHNMQCLVKDSGNSECTCLPGYQKHGDEYCQACPFGYSGVNCEDKFQLILIIMGTIAGIIIIGMVIALIVTSSKKQKDVEEQNLIENDFQNLRLRQQTTGFSNLGAEGNLFPKVRANFSKPHQNPYANPRGMPLPDY